MEEAALRAVSNPNRRQILRLVWDEELTSGEIAAQFDISWPAVSQNLRVLESADLVKCRHAGTTRYYRADKARLGPLKSVLKSMWEADIDRLAELAEAEERGRNKGRP